jgi:hypothetical protein
MKAGADDDQRHGLAADHAHGAATVWGGGAELGLNGAQIQAALDIISKVSAGEIPRESGSQSMQILFGFTPQQADRLLPPAAAIKPKTEDTAP